MNNSNKYGSLKNAFIGPDMYNAALGITPPADLVLTAGPGIFVDSYLRFRNGSGTDVVGFNPRDNLYVRSLGFTSNLADGLVDSASNHNVGNTSWLVNFLPQLFGSGLAGIGNAAGSAAVTGSGFTRILAPGMTIVWYDDNFRIRSGVVLTITDDSNLVLTAATINAGMLTGATTASTAYQLVGRGGYAGVGVNIPFLILNVFDPYDFFLTDASDIYPRVGTISTVAASATLTGVGTKFLTDYAADSVIGWTDDAGVRRTGCVSAVATDVSLTLTAVAYSNATAVTPIDLAHHIRVRTRIPYEFNAYTVGVDPTYAGLRFSLSALAEIEHTFAMTVAI